MALTTFEEMKQEIRDNLEQFTDSNYPEDLLTEFADSAIPAYNNQIIAEWVEMPSEWNDSWREHGVGEQQGIISLMTSDLFFYYLDLANRAWQAIREELEEEAE